VLGGLNLPVANRWPHAVGNALQVAAGTVHTHSSTT
jgi:hypothetical protein